jgi:hypothetical protein
MWRLAEKRINAIITIMRKGPLLATLLAGSLGLVEKRINAIITIIRKDVFFPLFLRVCWFLCEPATRISSA